MFSQSPVIVMNQTTHRCTHLCSDVFVTYLEYQQHSHNVRACFLDVES
jgi:hypothetical protein